MAKTIGRPRKYTQEYNDQARKLCLLGATDKDLANFFEVEESTINKWKLDFPAFSESIKAGKEVADANIADRLYQRAMGFEHDSEEIKIIGSEVERVPVRKVYPPDTTAAIFWLKNRRQISWRDQQNIDHTTKGNELPTPQVYLPTDLPEAVVPQQQP